MTETLVKICGVRTPEIARTVAELGADLMGLIFAPSRRQVSPEQAQEILEGTQALESEPPKAVGVFVNESVERMNEIADQVGLGFIQLSGDEPVEIQARLGRPVIRALRLPPGIAFSDARRVAERYLDCASPARALLLDTHLPGIYGGTGIQGDWQRAEELADLYPVILAGGLRPDTVGRALERVRPFGVDVSSGVETDGEKDPDKIEQFIEAVRHGDQRRAVYPNTIDMVRSHG